ncbi:putative predicted protein [Rhizobium favelukesii]|uniref:Uncharacterized protein n=1 Tax=Rhizobium favelukesii TaxID=348824 RepID=W6R9L4_9HYPH|nr:putative predicted protein [Rhizobium favelukesii]
MKMVRRRGTRHFCGFDQNCKLVKVVRFIFDHNIGEPFSICIDKFLKCRREA